ncbi:MAG: nucleotide pyrophosphohydrolase [Candidatus Aenigmatarchaeota archaeon]
MKDEETTFEELRQRIMDFREGKGWRKYDAPKDLSMAISIEASELMEHFYFTEEKEIQEKIREEDKFLEVRRELADILIYSIAMANLLNIDIVETIDEKIERLKERGKEHTSEEG